MCKSNCSIIKIAEANNFYSQLLQKRMKRDYKCANKDKDHLNDNTINGSISEIKV